MCNRLARWVRGRLLGNALRTAVECVLADYADQFNKDASAINTNLAELAHVYEQLTGWTVHTEGMPMADQPNPSADVSEPPAMSVADAANHYARGVANMRELLAPLDEATLGYRAQLEATGWSSPAAEQMAVMFYTSQMIGFTAAVSGGKS